MPLTRPSTGATIAAAHVDQLVDVLQRLSGQTETGAYYITGTSSTGGAASIGYYVSSESRGVSPVSVSIDTSIQAVQNFSAPGTDHATANGFHVFANTTGNTSAANVGGVYTLSY
jgi:hypothetical protein